MVHASIACVSALFIATARADHGNFTSTGQIPQCANFEVEAPDTDLAGTLLGSEWTATLDECCHLCAEKETCHGFAYFEQICHLKANFIGTFPKVGVISRLKKDLGSGCPGFDIALEDRDLVGDLLEDWSTASSDACCAACSQNAECDGFAFLAERCYLKGNVRGTYDHLGCTAQVKQGVLSQGDGPPLLAQCPLFETLASDTDIAGSLLGAHWAATVDECCPLCDSVDGCEGFSYSEQVCYLKGAFSGTFQKAGVISRVKKDLGSGCPGFGTAEHGKDLIGDLLEAWAAPKAEVCCAACAERADCQGFAFLDGQCYLKGNARGTYDRAGCMVQVKEGAESPSDEPPVIPQCPLFEEQAADTDLAGSLLARHWAATVDECCPLCSETEGCEGFAYFEQICYLKGAFLGSFKITGVVSRIKKDLGSGCPGYATAQQGKDLAGKLLDSWPASKPEVCCAACAERADCQGFAFNQGSCYLKGSVQGTYDRDGCMAQTKAAVLAVGGGARRLAEKRFLV